MKAESFAGHNLEIDYVAGGYPYLWIGDSGVAIATVGTLRNLRALRKLCDRAIAKYERESKPKERK